MSFANDYTATRAILTRLSPLFAAAGAYGAKLKDAEGAAMGADVVLSLDEDTKAERIGKPYLLIAEPSGERSPFSAAIGNWRFVAVGIHACATDFSGQQVGTANPVNAIELMSRDLQADVLANYTTWRGLGLYDIQIASQPAMQIPNSDGTAGARAIPHRVTFHYQVS